MTLALSPERTQEAARIRAEMARRAEVESLGLLAYTVRMFPGYTAAPHHVALAQALERVERGECLRLIVNMPPQYGKSEQVSVRFPPWYLGKHPDRRIISTSYAATLAQTFSGQARDQIADERYPFAIALKQDTKAKQMWNVAGHRGGYIAAGVGGTITWLGANVFMIDDPIKNREEADSETIREKVWNWYTSVVHTRLRAEDAAVVLVCTRWHEDDLAGRLLAEAQQGGEQWEVLSFPAIAEEGDALGREPGEALWPSYQSAAYLLAKVKPVSSRDWAALYQQRPTLEEGALFKRQWFEVVDAAPVGLRWARYWDLAASTKTTADYTASAAVALDKEGVLWIRDMIRDRWEWPDAQKVIAQTMLAEPKTVHMVEEAMHGMAAVQTLRRMPALAPIALIGVRPDKDKVTRALSWAARAEGGRVRLVRGSWVNAFLDEVCSFPHGAHDDQVDSVSGAVSSGRLNIEGPREMTLTYNRARKPEIDPLSMAGLRARVDARKKREAG